MSRFGYTIVVGSLAAVLSGCAGNGMGLDANGNPVKAGGGGAPPLTADFQSIQDNVFTPICTKCHIGGGAPEGLQLDQSHSYAMLVGVPSTEQPNVLRVDPGNPDASYVVRKLQGTSGITGARMPFGGPYLPQSTIDVIRQWVSDGAMQSAAAAAIATAKVVQRFTVTSSSPDAESVAAMVPRIVVAFSSDLDPSLVNDTTVTLEKLDTTPGPGMPGDEPMQSTAPMHSTAPMQSTVSMSPMASTLVATATALPAGNTATLLITPRASLANGTYRVTLRASVASMNAQALGSDYSFKFRVEAP